MIKFQMIGHLGQNAVSKEVNGKQVLNFTVAYNERFKDAQGMQRERTVWADCALWGQPNIGPYLTQGQQVFVEGAPRVESYTDREGKPGASLRVLVSKCKLLGSARKDNAEGVAAPEESVAYGPQTADDLPF
ncbi:single-stranded DNA-binding protein [Chitinophaga sedimenti]|uniref:single-stranded DNA-binding protein n=1 Tax=Chitinophaga sedimenti TaxID=2033606 RepID=UPI0020063560|nr:single-stranded DNA-binding protein [Chitinophaga sedimenti]MCK7556976.1 single-stranded DNA-binding protein [Chitinophaga sedimenti]